MAELDPSITVSSFTLRERGMAGFQALTLQETPDLRERRLFSGVKEALQPLVQRVGDLVLGPPPAAIEPQQVIFEINAVGERVPVDLDEMKPLGEPKNNPDTLQAPYENTEGTTQVLYNLGIPEVERPTSNDVLAPVIAELFSNNGAAPIEEIAAKTGQDKEFVRGHGKFLTGIFQLYTDPASGQEMLESKRLKGKKLTRNDEGWHVVVPVTHELAMNGAD
jgi:hypothetical protein